MLYDSRQRELLFFMVNPVKLKLKSDGLIPKLTIPYDMNLLNKDDTHDYNNKINYRSIINYNLCGDYARSKG